MEIVHFTFIRNSGNNEQNFMVLMSFFYQILNMPKLGDRVFQYMKFEYKHALCVQVNKTYLDYA